MSRGGEWKSRGQKHDHVQCVPERPVPWPFAQVTALTPGVCKTACFPRQASGRVAWIFLR
jgi:hypothetical protein